MLFYYCTNNANKSPVSPRSAFSNCHVLLRYLHSIVHVLFNYRTARHEMPWVSSFDFRTSGQPYNQPCWCQLDRNYDHQISTSIRVKCWWDRVFFRQRTVVDAEHRGGWTQIFGGKASEIARGISGPVVKRNFTYPICISRTRWGDSIVIS